MSFISEDYCERKIKSDDFRNLYTDRFSKTLILEQEKYLSGHPEITDWLKFYFRSLKMEQPTKVLLNPIKTSRHIRNQLKKFMNNMSLPQSYAQKEAFCYQDHDFYSDMVCLLNPYRNKEDSMMLPLDGYSLPTQSSSFISVLTSQTTIPTPELSPIPEATVEEIFRGQILQLVDKAVFGTVNDTELNYDTAYVELMKAVEEAMELTVVEIREDIGDLLMTALQTFESRVIEKERYEAEILWEKRMRKKQKRLVRRQKKFIGTELESSSSMYNLSSHPSEVKPPFQPCECSPQFKYNRYAKDKFGIYKPRAKQFAAKNTTVTPEFSIQNEHNASMSTIKSRISNKKLL